MKVSAYNFAIPRTSADIHKALFSHLAKLNIKEYINRLLPSGHADRNSILCMPTDNFIMVRTPKKQDQIKMIEDVLEVHNGQTITGRIILSHYRRAAFTQVQIQQFKDKHGRLPSRKEATIYKYLDEREFKEYACNLLARHGLEVNYFSADVILPDIFLVTKRSKIDLMPSEVFFKATVADESLLCNAWLHGIGQYKTYGLGLLRVTNHD